MTIFLVVYDRHLGQLLSITPYAPSERDRAERERLEAELDSVQRRLGYEIVLLEAEGEDDLRKTHARYFKNLRELVAG